MWNFTLKIVFVALSWAIVWLMRTRFKSSYSKEYDSFRSLFAYVPCAALALLLHAQWAPFELLWTFSLYLEAVAILPQLFLLQRTGEHEQFTLHYIFALGLYRALYLVNWIYRAFTESYHGEWIVWLAGIVQTALFCDFFYYYLKRCIISLDRCFVLCKLIFSFPAGGMGDRSIFRSDHMLSKFLWTESF